MNYRLPVNISLSELSGAGILQENQANVLAADATAPYVINIQCIDYVRHSSACPAWRRYLSIYLLHLNWTL